MTVITLARPAAPTLPALSPAARYTIRLVTEGLVLTVQSAVFAAALWLLVAVPGFVSNLASTIPLAR